MDSIPSVNLINHKNKIVVGVLFTIVLTFASVQLLRDLYVFGTGNNNIFAAALANIASVLGAGDLPDVKLGGFNDNYHRCQNKLGGPIGDVNQFATAYEVGMRYVQFDVDITSPAQFNEILNSTANKVNAAYRNHLTPILVMGKSGDTIFKNQGLLVDFLNKLDEITDNAKFVATTAPQYYMQIVNGQSLYKDAVIMSMAVAAELTESRDILTAPPVMRVSEVPSCDGFGATCVKVGEKNFFTEVTLTLVGNSGDRPGLSLRDYDTMLVSLKNYDSTFRDGSNKPDHSGYSLFDKAGAKAWLEEYNNQYKSFARAIILDYGPAFPMNLDNDDQKLKLMETLGYDFGRFSDQRLVDGVVLAPDVLSAYFPLANNKDVYKRWNLYGTNCNYDLVDYEVAYSEQSTAKPAGKAAGNNASGKARSNIICSGATEMCEANIRFTIQVGLPVRHFGSNTPIGTDTHPYQPLGPALASSLNIPNDFLNQYASPIEMGEHKYMVPWLGNAINAAYPGLNYLNSAPQSRTETAGEFAPGGLPTATAGENGLEGNFNLWSYADAISFGDGKKQMRDETVIYYGKDLGNEKSSVQTIDGFRSYDSRAQANTFRKVNFGSVKKVKNDAQNMVYGSEMILKEVKFEKHMNVLAYEVANGTRQSNQLKYRLNPGANCRCKFSSGALGAVTIGNLRAGCALTEEQLIKNKCVQFESLGDYYESDLFIEADFPKIDDIEIPGVYDALAALYNQIQREMANRNEKLIFNEGWGWESDIIVRSYSAMGIANEHVINKPRQNQMLNNFNFRNVTINRSNSSASSSSAAGGSAPACKVGINFAALAGIDPGVYDKAAEYGYSHGLVMVTGPAQSEVSAGINAANQMCERGIIPVMRSCYIGKCDFTGGTQQGQTLAAIVNGATSCAAKDIYVICGHNEPVPENPRGMVNEGEWTRNCVNAVKSGAPDALITTPTFNATHPGFEQHAADFFTGYGSFNASDFACVSFNTYDNVGTTGSVDINSDGAIDVLDHYQRVRNIPQFKDMPSCIMETGFAFPNAGDQEKYAAGTIEKLFGYDDNLLYALGFNWTGANPDPVWANFVISDELNKKIANCDLNIIPGGEYDYEIPGEYMEDYRFYLTEGKNIHQEKQYYEMLGFIDELVKIQDLYLYQSNVSAEINRAFIGWPSCDDAVARALQAKGEKVNCIGKFALPGASAYVQDPLAKFLCEKGYYVVGESCNIRCDNVPVVSNGNLGNDVCHPGNACDSFVAAGKNGVNYPVCRDTIKVAGTDTFCGSLAEINTEYGTGSSNIFNSSTPVIDRLKLAEDAGDANSEVIGAFGTFQKVNRKIIDKVRAVETEIAQWKNGEFYNFPSGKYKFISAGAFNRRAETCQLNSGTTDLACLSMHSFGLALDFNVGQAAIDANGGDNPFYLTERQCRIDIPPEFVEAMEKHGFRWGGRYGGDRFDPMHFEYNPHCITGEIPQTNTVNTNKGPTIKVTENQWMCNPVVEGPDDKDLPTGCNEFNCFPRGEPADTYEKSLQCVYNNTSGYLRNLPTDRWVDTYGPFCDNETRGLPFAYNLFRYYDQYLPVGSPAGRICADLPPAGALAGGDSIRCRVTGQVTGMENPTVRQSHPKYDQYRGALKRCPIPTNQQRWTPQNSNGITRVPQAQVEAMTDEQIAIIVAPLAQKMHNEVVYSGMRLSNTPLGKVQRTLTIAYRADLNPYILVGIWATESWFGQFRPQCNVY